MLHSFSRSRLVHDEERLQTAALFAVSQTHDKLSFGHDPQKVEILTLCSWRKTVTLPVKPPGAVSLDLLASLLPRHGNTDIKPFPCKNSALDTQASLDRKGSFLFDQA